MSVPLSPESPDQVLAALIVEKLAQRNLVPVNRMPEIAARIASGAAKADDWSLWADFTNRQEAARGNNGRN